MKTNNIIEAFFALLRAGLWEKGVHLLPFGKVDFADVMKLAEEQSVVGLVAAGIVHVTDVKHQKREVLPFIQSTVPLETKKKAMNQLIGSMVEKKQKATLPKKKLQKNIKS